jgi:uncharacterized membrane protein YfcA
MEITFATYLILCPLIFLAGFLDSIAGGGGLIALPAYLLAGVPPYNAVATVKVSSFMGKTTSCARFLKNKLIDIKLALPAMALAVCGSAAGARLILLVPENIIRYILLGVLPVIAAFVFFKKDFCADDAAQVSRKKQVAVICFFSLILGAYDGFLRPGTGTFLILIYTKLGGMPVKKAVGTMKAVNFASNIGSLIVFISSGKVIYILGLAAGVFCVLGNYIGSGLVVKNGGKIVRPIIILVIILLFLKIILGF